MLSGHITPPYSCLLRPGRASIGCGQRWDHSWEVAPWDPGRALQEELTPACTPGSLSITLAPRCAQRNPRVLRRAGGGIGPVGLEAQVPGPPVLSHTAPLSPAFCFCPGMPWERRKDGKDFPHLIIKEHKIQPSMLEKRFLKAGPFAESTHFFIWVAYLTCPGMSFG